MRAAGAALLVVATLTGCQTEPSGGGGTGGLNGREHPIGEAWGTPLEYAALVGFALIMAGAALYRRSRDAA